MKFFKVTITRHQYTDLYLGVPDDFTGATFPDEKTLILATDATVSDSEWETDQHNLEAIEMSPCDESEARMYGAFDTNAKAKLS